jgi:Lon-like protease
MLTTHSSLPTGLDGPASPLRRPRWLIVLTGFLLVASIGCLVLQYKARDYFALSPGTAPDVSELIKVPADRAHPHRGKLLLVTVALRLKLTPFEYLIDQLDPNIDLVSAKAILGSTPRNQLTQENDQLMSESAQAAIAVAMRRIGYQVTEEGNGAEVAQVMPGSGADGHLQPGDVIAAIDGSSIPTNDALVRAIRAHHPGDVVHLAVTSPGGQSRTETVTLSLSPPSAGAQRTFLGVAAITKDLKFVTPFPVTIDAGLIGGPSAGLAFTLGVIDALSPRSITGGHRIAATGTIDLDGTVGEVGGVTQKTVAVRDAGAEEFLVPAAEYQDAKAHAGSHMKVVQVNTLDDALAALKALGGDLSALGTAPAPASH